MKQRVFNILISFAVGVLGVVQVLPYLKGDEPPEIKVVHIINEEQPDFFSKSPQEGLIEALEYYKVKHPQIVYAQAVLETGHFKSDLCLNGNNLFGLYNSKKHRYYTFDHWTESVVAYLDYVQYRYKPPNDYYKFLSDIGYAEDPNYINKLKGIVSRNDKRRSE
jgi:flagellum-specific peptidoglycan hydrolase FlgJ